MEKQTLLSPLAANLAGVVGEAEFGCEFGKRAMLDPRLEDDPSLELRDRSGRDRVEKGPRDLGALIAGRRCGRRIGDAAMAAAAFALELAHRST